MHMVSLVGEISVIPLKGKKPNTTYIQTWTKFQKQQPTTKEIQKWFVEGEITSYAVIMGHVSGNLFGLDFDDRQRYRAFKREFPEYTEALTVKTRRGYHVYLRAEQVPKGIKFNGGELQGEGQYLVGPGSNVAGHTYETVEIKQPKQLTKEEIKTLIKWLCKEEVKNIASEFKKAKYIRTPENIVAFYKKKAPEIGRNNALYVAAARARAIGTNIQTAKATLTPIHAEMQTNQEHPVESYTTRVKEGIKTIESAYSGTAALKPQVWQVQAPGQQGLVPNALREEILQQKDGCTAARLLEACIREGYEAGQRFTLADILAVANKYKIGETQVRRMIEGNTGTAKSSYRLFPTVNEICIKALPSKNPLAGDTDNEKKNQQVLFDLETFVDGHESHEYGRTAKVFIFPSLDYLCSICDVTPIAADCLNHVDLLSNKAYRKALLRELIKRTSPELSVEWHAHRLNVSTRTVRRYLDELNVLITPIFEYVVLDWNNVDDVSLWTCSTQVNKLGKKITPGQWIQDSEGDRYPAIKEVAISWMSRLNDRKFIMCYRRPSRIQLPQAGMPIMLHKVIWRRAELEVKPEWCAGEYDFPPVESLSDSGLSEINDKKFINTSISNKSTALDSFFEHTSPNFFGEKLNSYALLEDVPEEALSARRRMGIHSYQSINESLKLVDGLGASRIEQLEEVGIFTLEQLIVTGAVRVYQSIPWRGREYLSVSTCKLWIEYSKVLLDWQEPTQEMIRKKQRKIAKKARRDYKKNFWRFVDYLEKIRDYEHDVFGMGDMPELSWNKLLRWFRVLEQRFKSDGDLFFDPRIVDKVHKTVCEFCEQYISRTDIFLEMNNTNLECHGFGKRKDWKAFRQTASRQIERFRHNDVWTGWN